jgi:hypothetical protein
MNGSRRAAWAGLWALVIAAFAIVAVPVVLIRPFAPQTPGSMALAFGLRRWSPLVTLLAAAAALFLIVRLWRAAPRVVPRAAALLAGLLVFSQAWLSRQNHFEWMFAPLPDARSVRAAQAEFVAPGDMVLAVAMKGDAVAYPIRQLAYHHVVEDAIGGVPIVATY